MSTKKQKNIRKQEKQPRQQQIQRHEEIGPTLDERVSGAMDDEQEYNETHNEEKVSKPLKQISLHLITKRHLPPDAQSWQQDEILSELNKISHVRLDRENIGTIDGLELLGPKVTNLYLQCNSIQNIENLEFLNNLRFLTLSNNQIRKIEGLTHLNKLTLLDLSSNLIVAFDIDELPQSLVIFSLKGNPCTNVSDYRGSVVQDMAKLRDLDGEEVTRTERKEAGYVVSESSEDEDEDEDEEEFTGCDVSAADMMLRSQVRTEESLKDHKKHLTILDKIRTSNHLPPSPRTYSNLSQDMLG